ncbi:MAG: protein kinase [Actinomycetota bacterium]|nr:protein kinase [Actinomycetota bacterium]
MSSDGRETRGGAPSSTSVAGRYVLEDLVARGGMGTVYRARDEVLARPVAVKILHPHLSEDPSFLARFRREAVAAAGLGHPSIVSIYDTGTDASEGVERHYIVMEHCGGGTLTELLRARGPLDPQHAASVVAGICSALDYAHRAGVVHRDVKPDNVLFAEDGSLKVADFGIAKAAYASGDITTTGSILGTVTYVSPEQAEGREPDARSDIYSAGVVLYELLVGRPPFSGETDVATAMMHLRQEPTPVRALKPQVPRHLEAAVMKALAKDPEARWSSADEMSRALQGTTATGSTVVLSHAATPPGGTVPPAETDHPGDTRWVAPVLALVAFAALLAFVVPRLLDEDGVGTRGRGRDGGPGGGGAAAVTVRGVESFDPDGDGEEHGEEAPLVVDGDPGTAWTSETYSDPLELLGKEGIGLVLDLGDAAAISSVRVATSTPGMSLEIRAGDARPDDPDDLAVVASTGSAAAAEDLTFDPERARYWLVWITKLPGDGGGTVSIEEVTLRGPA